MLMDGFKLRKKESMYLTRRPAGGEEEKLERLWTQKGTGCECCGKYHSGIQLRTPISVFRTR
jgi:hypothetical protein